jgi:hypothetical protein
MLGNSFASANTTTLSGKFTGIPDEDVYGYAWVQKKVSGSWVDTDSGYTKDIYKEGNYSFEISEAVGTTIRVWSNFQGTNGSYLSISSEFELTAGAQSRDIPIGSVNIQLNLSNSLACNGGWANASSTGLVSDRLGEEGVWAPILSGVVKFAVPSGLGYTISGNCNGNITYETTLTSTTNLQTVAVTVSTPNVTGKISGFTNTNNFYASVQTKNTADASATWQILLSDCLKVRIDYLCDL